MFTIIIGSAGAVEGGFFFFSLWGLMGWEDVEVVLVLVFVAAAVFCVAAYLGASGMVGCDPVFATTDAGALGSGTLFASVCGSR